MDEDIFDEPQPEAPAEAVVDGPEEAVEAAEPSGDGKGGPGFLLGLLLGMLLGAVVAYVLSAPDESEAGATSGLRARFRLAAEEGREAAQEKEAELRSRYEELTR